MTTEQLNQWKAYLANLKGYEKALAKWLKKQKDDGIETNTENPGDHPPPPPPHP